MLILIKRYKKEFSKNNIFIKIEHDVTTSKTTFLSLLPRECMSRYFLDFFVMYAIPIPVQTKVHFKNLHFFAMTYDMGLLSYAFDVV